MGEWAPTARLITSFSAFRLAFSGGIILRFEATQQGKVATHITQTYHRFIFAPLLADNGYPALSHLWFVVGFFVGCGKAISKPLPHLPFNSCGDVGMRWISEFKH